LYPSNSNAFLDKKHGDHGRILGKTTATAEWNVPSQILTAIQAYTWPGTVYIILHFTWGAFEEDAERRRGSSRVAHHPLPPTHSGCILPS
jgi:hypothetical protein